jgi:hypothetical protein
VLYLLKIIIFYLDSLLVWSHWGNIFVAQGSRINETVSAAGGTKFFIFILCICRHTFAESYLILKSYPCHPFVLRVLVLIIGPAMYLHGIFGTFFAIFFI